MAWNGTRQAQIALLSLWSLDKGLIRGKLEEIKNI